MENESTQEKYPTSLLSFALCFHTQRGTTRKSDRFFQNSLKYFVNPVFAVESLEKFQLPYI